MSAQIEALLYSDTGHARRVQDSCPAGLQHLKRTAAASVLLDSPGRFMCFRPAEPQTPEAYVPGNVATEADVNDPHDPGFVHSLSSSTWLPHPSALDEFACHSGVRNLIVEAPWAGLCHAGQDTPRLVHREADTPSCNDHRNQELWPTEGASKA